MINCPSGRSTRRTSPPQYGASTEKQQIYTLPCHRQMEAGLPPHTAGFPIPFCRLLQRRLGYIDPRNARSEACFPQCPCQLRRRVALTAACVQHRQAFPLPPSAPAGSAPVASGDNNLSPKKRCSGPYHQPVVPVVLLPRLPDPATGLHSRSLPYQSYALPGHTNRRSSPVSGRPQFGQQNILIFLFSFSSQQVTSIWRLSRGASPRSLRAHRGARAAAPAGRRLRRLSPTPALLCSCHYSMGAALWAAPHAFS